MDLCVIWPQQLPNLLAWQGSEETSGLHMKMEFMEVLLIRSEYDEGALKVLGRKRHLLLQCRLDLRWLKREPNFL